MSEIVLYWSRKPGKFVNSHTGDELNAGIKFDGTVREWYETLVETLFNARNRFDADTQRDITVYAGSTMYIILQTSVLWKYIDLKRPTRGGIISNMKILEDRSISDSEIEVVCGSKTARIVGLDFNVI